MPEELRAKIDLAERLARIEEKIDYLKSDSDVMANFSERLTRVEMKAVINKEKNEDQERKLEEVDGKVDKAKKEIYWIAGIIVAAINFVLFLIEKAGGAR